MENKMKKRSRPNAWFNRYNQWVLAGKIAVATGAIDPYEADGKIASIYRSNHSELHYSSIGQDFLRQLGIKITELED